jgi:hypothetical protein
MTPPKEIKFDMHVNLGHVITIATVVVAMIFGYTRLEAKAEYNQTEIKIIKDTYVKKEVFEVAIQRLERIENKLDKLIEKEINR